MQWEQTVYWYALSLFLCRIRQNSHDMHQKFHQQGGIIGIDLAAGITVGILILLLVQHYHTRNRLVGQHGIGYITLPSRLTSP